MNKSMTDYGSFESSAENRRLLRREELILEVTEALAEALERSGMTKTELARRLGCSKGLVSQMLAGGRNLTLRSVADLADALDQRVRVRVCDQKEWLKSSLSDQRPTETTWSVSAHSPFKLVKNTQPSGEFDIDQLTLAGAA